MYDKPIFVAAHPRACSTAFERVFMTQHETITCFHEPFGDAFYYGPERLSPRFSDEQARLDSGFSKSTYGSILENIKREASNVRPFYLEDFPDLEIPGDFLLTLFIGKTSLYQGHRLLSFCA